MASWYREAIVYEVLVSSFKDGDGDGIGDFIGLTQALDYLANLGVTCLWLPPFLDSPRRDEGYDIRDYYAVDPRFGSQGDFARFLRRANERGLRVIVDVAFNHTSIEHPWFQEARESPDSPYRDFYLWSDEAVDVPGDANVVGEGRVWTFDEVAGQYYHHTYFSFQPDLNVANERVRDEIAKVLEYWLRFGVSGFRLDAVPLMLKEKPGLRFDGDPYAFLGELRELVAARRRDAVLLAEGDVGPREYAAYFGDGDRLHMALDFFLSAHLGSALAREEAAPLRRALEDLPSPPRGSTYANFLRSHDEWSFRQIPDAERREVLAALSPDEDTHMYGTGIRRRLAPLLGGDERRIRLAHSLLLSMPGTPVLYYGDEIGMGDDLAIPGRAAVRTPMQWSDGPNAGFSSAPPDRLVRPVVAGGAFGFERINAASQRRDPESLLNWMMRAVRARRECPEFGLAGRADLLDTGDARVLAHACRHRKGTAIALHNLAGDEVEVALEAPEPCPAAPVEVFSDRAYPPLAEGRVRLGPYGYRWFRCHEFPF